ncbi:MAG TPA: hypothetical protein VD927_16175 [Chryseosolibacter sp.]|nr:hypothetical protein [Chryseosolibacter sp.]
MELEELKDIWNKSNKGFHLKGESELAGMLKGNSRSIIDKLKRNVWFELIVTIVAGVGLLVYAMTLPTGALKWTTVSILVLFVAYSFYYVKKLSLLRRFDPGHHDVRSSLESLIGSLSAYVNFYKRSYTLLYPVYFGLGVLFGGLETGSSRFYQLFTDTKALLLLSGSAIVFFFITTWFADWYLRKLYGNHIAKLKDVLRELNSGEM